ncbi:MAG: acyltransferase [Chloroflexi bacterium CFX4]|nr:acyltransferase [Chloroflexi bacterium CFX4]MDL1923177.1 acyltransferase [Chloroflexi bacterium CFX3]
MLSRAFKRLVRALFGLLVSLAYLAYRVEGVNALLLIMPAKLIVPTLRRYGATIGENAQIHSPLIIHNAGDEHGKAYANLVIGDHCYMGRDVFLDLAEKITLEDYVTISMRCTLLTHTNVGERPPDLVSLPATSAPILLRRGAYLGACSTVLEGVIVGERGVVAAGALVRHSVADGAIVGGVPSRPLQAEKPLDE